MAEDEETAKKIAYTNNINRYMCVTLKGDKYNPQGTLEGGYQKNQSVLANVDKYKQLYDKKISLLA